MAATREGDPIQHREHGGRGEFYIEREGRRVGELTYSASGNAMVVGHTWVDPKLRGGRLAPSLVEAAVDYARRESRKIVPVCSYVRAVFGRSGDYDDVWQK
jgi:predicted GNAT family acetyltransferase